VEVRCLLVGEGDPQHLGLLVEPADERDACWLALLVEPVGDDHGWMAGEVAEQAVVVVGRGRDIGVGSVGDAVEKPAITAFCPDIDIIISTFFKHIASKKAEDNRTMEEDTAEGFLVRI